MRKYLLVLVIALSYLSPLAHAEETWACFSCGFVATTDPTNVITQDPTKFTGEVDFGPCAILNTAGGTVGSVTGTCTFQINNGAHGGGGVSRSSTVAGNVGVLVDTISYNAVAGDDVYLCTSFSWTSSKGGGSAVYDADDVTPGDQCALASSIEAR